MGFLTGILSGFLGVGGGFVRVPLLIYVLGVPTTIATGTDLLETLVSAAYSTMSHLLNGNVDLLIAIITSIWGCIGAYFGAIFTQYVSGQKIRTLVKEQAKAGYYKIHWDGKNDAGMQVPSGVYLYQLRTNKFVQTKKMILLQ